MSADGVTGRLVAFGRYTALCCAEEVVDHEFNFCWASFSEVVPSKHLRGWSGWLLPTKGN